MQQQPRVLFVRSHRNDVGRQTRKRKNKCLYSAAREPEKCTAPGPRRKICIVCGVVDKARPEQTAKLTGNVPASVDVVASLVYRAKCRIFVAKHLNDVEAKLQLADEVIRFLFRRI